MTDPVISTASGKTYERGCITRIIHQTGRDPHNGRELTEDQLIPNDAIKDLSNEYRRRREAP